MAYPVAGLVRQTLQKEGLCGNPALSQVNAVVTKRRGFVQLRAKEERMRAKGVMFATVAMLPPETTVAEILKLI
jgi:hypothetical protein